jgi:hypothetical protein
MSWNQTIKCTCGWEGNIKCRLCGSEEWKQFYSTMGPAEPTEENIVGYWESYYENNNVGDRASYLGQRPYKISSCECASCGKRQAFYEYGKCPGCSEPSKVRVKPSQ